VWFALLAVPGHSWAIGKCHGYGNPLNSTEQLTAAFERQQAMLVAMKQPPSQPSGVGISASVYTEITDVETECNGLMTYDRVLKVIEPRVKAANDALTM
jgi:hypothetical protein